MLIESKIEKVPRGIRGEKSSKLIFHGLNDLNVPESNVTVYMYIGRI